MLKKLIEKLKENKLRLKKIAAWFLVITVIGVSSGATVYFCGENWFDQFLRSEYMQAKLWPKISNTVDKYAYDGISRNNYQRYETEHFIIFYQTDDLKLLQKVSRAAEKIYLPTSQKMRYTRTEKTPIVLLHDQEKSDYSQFGGVIRVTEKIVNEEKATAEEILSHEFTHMLVRDLTRDNMLRWLHEGIAEYVEAQISGKQPYYINKIEVKEYVYNVQELETNFANIPNHQGYGQSYLTVKFIVDKYGEDALFKIINELRDERVKEETAFKRVLGLDYKALCAQVALYKQGQVQ